MRRKIAEGGMAEIYLATSTGPEGFAKQVVIKRIRAFLASDPGFVEMFISEARLASRLDHANVVQIFDFDKHEDTYYLAMEYVRGRSLWDVRRRSKELMEPMPPTLVAHIGAEVARGLSYAHRLTDRGTLLNLVHRDVTPHNVLLSFEGAVKLTDFGVAKAGNSQTAAGVLKGKFAYMSPEQSRGEPVDARCDVFALGIVLWEMLTGGRLFDGDTDVAVLRAVQERVIASPARLNPDIPADLDAVVMKALQRDLSARFASAAELERALAEVVFRNARSLEDRDVGGYLRRLFPEDAEERTEGTRSSPQPGQALATPVAPPVREPTAIMGGAAKATPAPLSPDEDFHAATHVVERPASPATLELPSLRDRPAPQRLRATPAPDVAPAADPERKPQAAGMSDPVAVTPDLLDASVVPGPAAKPRAPASVLVGVGALLVIGSVAGVAIFGNGTSDGVEATPETAQVVVPGGGDSLPEQPPTEAPAVQAAVEQPDPQPSAAAPPDLEPAQPVASPQNEPEQAPADAESQAALEAALAEKAAEAEKPEPEARSAPARLEGTVTLTVIPYAAVYLDGRKYLNEVSRTRRLKLPAGKHRLTLRHALGDKTFDFNLEPGGQISLRHNFMKK